MKDAMPTTTDHAGSPATLVRRHVVTIAGLRMLLALVVVVSLIAGAYFVMQSVAARQRPISLKSTPQEGVMRLTVLLTTCMVALVLSNGCGLGNRGFHALGLIGIACALAGYVAGLNDAWNWWGWAWPFRTQQFVMTVTMWCWSAAMGLIAMLSLVRVPRHLKWLPVVTALAIGGLGFLLADVVWSRDRFPRSRWIWVATDICLVLASCGMGATLIVHKLGLAKRALTASRMAVSIRLKCPRCGSDERADVGTGLCSGCGLKLHIEIADAECDGCGYPLHGLTSERCPECGTPFRRRPPATESASPLFTSGNSP